MLFDVVTVDELEGRLDSFDADARADALCTLAARVESGEIALPGLKGEVNLHFHTFFSFNAHGWSPSRIAWEARKYGLAIAGIVDFDVLDGMEEFLSAGEILSLRTTAALETRVFISKYADHVMSSPNEPGIAYFMGAGCFQLPPEGSRSAETLQSMRDMARQRNVQVVQRVNAFLDVVQIDYDRDVLPLTPSGNATERHMLAAYDAKAREVFAGDVSALSAFWAKALDGPGAPDHGPSGPSVLLHERIRSKLMKFGGVGYVPPAPETFPTLEAVIDMVRGMEALPMATWLDGTNPGEADTPALLDLLSSKGVVAMNMVPERNWNLKDPEEKRTKVENLGKAVKAAREFEFPLCIGTELNKPGLPFVDNFSAPELQPYLNDFLDGAYFLWGHTFLARYAGIGYMSDWADARFGSDRGGKNEFYTAAGRLAGPGMPKPDFLSKNLRHAATRDVLAALGR